MIAKDSSRNFHFQLKGRERTVGASLMVLSKFSGFSLISD